MTFAYPVGLPALAILAIGTLAFVVAVLAGRGSRTDATERDAKRSGASRLGIVLQGFAIALISFGPQRIVLDPLGATALAEAAAVALLLAVAVALFVWARRTMGRNWSIVARTRADHMLVQDGPFRHLRHPIYSAIFLFLPAIAIATGHWVHLLVGVPLYALGTLIRIRVEERMLHALFGVEHDAYAARVPRFVPGLF